jgi:hypothetical protein
MTPEQTAAFQALADNLNLTFTVTIPPVTADPVTVDFIPQPPANPA